MLSSGLLCAVDDVVDNSEKENRKKKVQDPQVLRRFYRTSSEIVEEIILFQTTILSHTVLHSPDKYSQATNVQTSDIVCNKQLEIGCHEHCSSAI